MSKKNKRPEYDKLSERLQVLLKPHEFKMLDSIRHESPFPSNAAYVRALILSNFKSKKQLEMFPIKEG
jgi:hypothetical protein